ncbi:MAG: NACHT domain-containing protein [Sedimentisphaerales bacterium]|nr:NACHT domain-containing protein [Sedimentisphaerales bacterium]
MSDSVSIRILEKDANRRGDLFGRLMADLFVALGYEQPRLNIHKSGRELDLEADHRLEPRRAIGECKATAQPIGGDDLNKFVGALDVEHEDKRPLTGYFISLTGFKETAIEQEKHRRRTKIVTLTGSQVVDELVKGRILIPKEKATELAGRCCASLPSLTLDPEVELLAHERGWIWAVYYTQGKARTHFALIHSDGTPLARALADEVAASDRDCGGAVGGLVCLNPEPLPGLDTDPRVAQALAAYGQYLANECGFIQLDGLPADNDVGSRRLKLENLFVPLHLDVTVTVDSEQRKMERRPVGLVLSEHPRLALLAAPGGGKSTLAKRLAVAYADPSRQHQIDDKLPSRGWLPLFFRCRELRGLARSSFAQLLEALSEREPVRQHAEVFRAYVDRALLDGRVLLLVDGLDEIPDPGDRAAFVCTVRTALQAYPDVAAVVTSREAGFRHVAAHLAPVCTHAVVSPFNTDDIRRLSVAWHREVVGDTENVRADAEQLANTIVRNDRIERLAVNPLLLTTLLLVKRWVGSLPTRRAVLYGKAVEVLLMTWNTEGHEPIPDEEAMPQLCYVASGMMLAGLQKISRPRLASLLQQARDALPTELGYVKGTVDQFIHRVEDRSSLLMMTGHDVEHGRLVEFFEFRHLTFQEFLTARGMVEGWHPNRQESDTLVSVLEPHFDQEEWREVIPLAAVLGGKSTEGLIQRLTQLLNETDHKEAHNPSRLSPYLALGHCLADEAAARPDTIRAAIKALVRLGIAQDTSFAPMLARGRHGTELRDEAEKVFVAETAQLHRVSGTLMEVIWWQTTEGEPYADFDRLVPRFLELLEHPETLARCEGALGCARLFIKRPQVEGPWIKRIAAAMTPLLFSEEPAEQYAAGWAWYEIGRYGAWTPPSEPDVLGRMFALWQHSPAKAVRSGLATTIASQRLAPRDEGARGASIDRKEFEGVLKRFEKLDDYAEKPAALIIAWYLRAASDENLLQRVRALVQDDNKLRNTLAERTLNDLLEHLAE